MKKILFLLITTFTFTANSQTSIYHPFPDSNAVWNWHFWLDHCTPFSQMEETYSYTINGDTSINSVIYHKVSVPFINVINTQCSAHNEDGYRGCMRQDIAHKKVYFVLPGDTTENLIFDFNLHVGDSMPTLPFFCHSKLFVTNVDSALIGTTYRKRWTSDNFKIIEGIGGNWEFLGPMCNIIDGASGMLTCFKQNGITLYPDSLSNCDLINNITNISDNHLSVKLFPNPFHSSMSLLINEEKALMKIYNVFGNLVREEKISNFSAIINRGSLVEGIYFYTVRNEHSKMTSGKFIID